MDEILAALNEIICKARAYRCLLPNDLAVHNLADAYSAQQQGLLLLIRAGQCFRGAQRLFSQEESSL